MRFRLPLVMTPARSGAWRAMTLLVIGVVVLGLAICLVHAADHEDGHAGTAHGLCLGFVAILHIGAAAGMPVIADALGREVASAPVPIYLAVPDPPPWFPHALLT